MYKRTEYIKTLLQKAEEESYGKDRVILLFNGTQYKRKLNMKDLMQWILLM